MARLQDPDRMLAAALYGHARRLALEAGSINEARQFLTERAAGRYDLLAQEAGSAAGNWTVTAQRSHPVELLAAGLLLVSAPVDLAVVAHWIDVSRRRASAPKHGTTEQLGPYEPVRTKSDGYGQVLWGGVRS